VNPQTDHRPTGHTVIKESTRMTSLRRRMTRVVSSIDPLAVGGGASGSKSAATASAEASSGRTQGGRVAALLARPRTMRCAAFAAAVLVLGAVEASPAAAAQPWWNLNTSTRPAVLNPGGETTLVIRAADLGNGPTSIKETVEFQVEVEPGVFSTEHIQIPSARTLTATLPPGVEVVEEEEEGEIIPQVSFRRFGNNPFIPRGGAEIGLTSFLGRIARYCHVAGPQVTCSTEPASPRNDPRPEEEGGVGPATFEAFVLPPLEPYEYIEMSVKVKDVGAAPGATFTSEVSGGGAEPLARTEPLPIGAGAASFGAEKYSLIPEAEGGAVDARAGSHPYQLTATFNLNQSSEFYRPPALPRNLNFLLPAGQIGNAQATPKCSPLDFTHIVQGGSENLCPQSTVLGVALITIGPGKGLVNTYPVPLFNLQPAPGEPARFGFTFVQAPVILDTALRSGPGEDYGVTVSSKNTTQLVPFASSTVTFWGTPGDPAHDNSRGWSCLANGSTTKFAGRNLPCEPQKQQKPTAFLTLPTDCEAPFLTSAEGNSWSSPTTIEQIMQPLTFNLTEATGTSLSGCNQLPFDPQIHSEPTSSTSTSPTGLSFDINFDDEGLIAAQGRAESQMKKAVVSLPEGFTTNPSVAEGLKACSEAEYESSTLDGSQGCTQESKVGEVEITSPLVEPVVHGSIYVARQHDNPNHNLLTLYMVARNEETGVLIRQALKVTPNPVTGQLTTEVDEVPQLPFSHFHLFFRPGQRAPLVTPPSCGTYTVGADLYPWARPTESVHRESGFQITGGPEGQGCPNGGTPPFHPVLLAGSENPTAGAYSPFYTEITRKDSEQEITHFSIKLPPGLSGKLVGVAQCSDAAIAAAKAREHEGGGEEELQHPSCPAASEVGHTDVGTGVGNVLAYAPGKLYLAGPYKGSNLSIVSITAAKVGPFDLGTVVIREGLKVDPTTAQVSVDAAGSDPIPHIVDGIPVHLRDIQIFVDRPSFTLNPTSCKKTSTASTVLGSGTNFASEADDQPVTVTSPFQVGSCASLGFKPSLGLQLKGKTRRGGLPKLIATVTYPKGGSYANIAKTIVTLPESELLEQGHIGTSCTRVQFNSGAGNGAGCPKNSIYGHARALTPLLEEPVEGPVYLRSNGGERQLPDLVAALHSKDIDINLVGFIDSVHKKGTERSAIRTRFLSVPDAPVSKFTLEMSGGKKGLLINSTNLCKGTHRAKSQFTAQNGKLLETDPAVQAQCGKQGKGKGGKGKKGSGKKKGAH
jgi:hypothetical protein